MLKHAENYREYQIINNIYKNNYISNKYQDLNQLCIPHVASSFQQSFFCGSTMPLYIDVRFNVTHLNKELEVHDKILGAKLNKSYSLMP